ncbi:MAG: type II toxin-antitoxin system VapC family toxin [Pseudomonadota bacterium]|nr:type II toxin-antitoxin system VapC family toxin [Pseudomonadota bacterium]
MLDTNVLSEFAKPTVDPAVLSWMRMTDELQMGISVVSIGEIQKGISRMPEGQRQQDLQVWLDVQLIPRFGNRALPLELSDLQRWGRLLGEAKKSGESLPPVDTLLAAVALNRDLIVVTRNTCDFKRTGVEIINPWTQ